MDTKKWAKKLLNIDASIDQIEKSIIYTFFAVNRIDFRSTSFFKEYFSDMNQETYSRISLELTNHTFVFDIEILIELFEMLIPKTEQKTNGMIYTPLSIKNYVINNVIVDNEPMTVCDPSCGCGSFLITTAEFMHNKYKLSFAELFTKYIYGVDIVGHNIEKTKVLFNVLALLHGEEITQEFNLHVGNSLELEWKGVFKNITEGFDAVVGNPPYVRSRNIDPLVKKSMEGWVTSSSGNVDLYIPFYELGLEIIKIKGRLGYISTNTFIQSVNGRALRNYLKENKYYLRILDFRETQVFKNVTSYTCIVIIEKSRIDGCIEYALLNGNNNLEKYNFNQYNLNMFEKNKPWRMSTVEIDSKIYEIEKFEIKLGDFKIRNGMATLKNEIFFFHPIKEDIEYYYRTYKNKKYKIEKKICIDIVKPNTIKTIEELNINNEKALFPYKKVSEKYKTISEEELSSDYPEAYSFLLDVKKDLLKRDKGNQNYENWFAYGRTQGMYNQGYKILLPYIAGSSPSLISDDYDLLFYCGYAVISESIEELIPIQRILSSRLFWYYIRNTSKPYSKGYMSLAKNYIKDFGIPNLSIYEVNKLVSIQNQEELDKYVDKLYGVDTSQDN